MRRVRSHWQTRRRASRRSSSAGTQAVRSTRSCSARRPTAHILGGACVGLVVDRYHRVVDAPGLHVVDGAAVNANLGVNPSLTIAAQAERALSLWPNAGDRDERPPLGTPYVSLPGITPSRPAVPAG